jgi:hypothetical protein
MTTPLTFDGSLAALIDATDEAFGTAAISRGRVLRDAKGQLAFVHAASTSDPSQRDAVTAVFHRHLGAYARPDRVIMFADDPGAKRLLEEDNTLVLALEGGRSLRLIDRRIVASGWLDRPREDIAQPPRVVFASLKGGVGRSTALSVTAADFAARGRNVLVVDLDLEAPGIGELLLTPDRKPDLGTLDFLVEDGIGGVTEEDLGRFVGVSTLTAGQGRVDVVPAFGRFSAGSPNNVLAKLARAVIEDIAEDGVVRPLSTQVAEMIDRLASREAYDIVLIDSRAGLAELAAPAVLGLGGLVLLFGTAQRQTIEGYRVLFAGLKMLAERDHDTGIAASWRMMFKPVFAKASLQADLIARFRDDLYNLFADYLYDSIDDEGSSVNRVGDFDGS